jgi:protein-tyrosine-phosphatase
MAMALMRKRLEDKGMTPEWVVGSAGTWATDGISATDNAIEAMRERELDLEPHLSRVVTEEMMASYDLILAMVSNHKEALQVEFPEYAQKVFLLSEMVGGDWDLDDPVGMPLEEYRATADLIEGVLQEGWENIVELGSV